MKRETSDRPERPAGWRVTDRPLRVAILGWARLSAQAREGSGYNLNASELATGLILAGHEVAYLRSGMHYTLARPGPFVREVETWRGIRCYSLVNSRNLSPASTNFRNMAAEGSSRRDNALVVQWLRRVGAQVAHIHSLEGFALDLVGEIRDSGLPVVVTPHNYHYACPQVDLLHKERDCCLDYQGGARCVGCLPAPPPGRARRNRAVTQDVERLVGPELTHALRQTGKLLGARVRGAAPPNRPGPEDQAQPDPELARGFDPGGPVHPGTFEHGLRVAARDRVEPLGRAPADANERFLGARDVHLRVVNEYGKRRQEGIAALNRASLVTPPSEFMCRAYEAMGVDRARLRHVRLGQPHFDQINRRARRTPYYGVRPWDPASARRPLRVAFWGTTRNNKGFGVLARAIERLDRDTRQRCQFVVHAGGGDWGYRKLLSRYPEVSFLGQYDTLMLLAGAGEYDVAVLPHIWFENSPLVMLEHLHAGKFIIASRLGGPVDWIHEPGSAASAANGGLGNGLLFPAGDDEALARCIERVVRGEVVLPSPREVHGASELWSYPDHIAEVEHIYREVLGELRPEPTPDAGRRVIEAKPAAGAAAQ
ncbi:MAG TPA: glycosyltransferase [Phycisphaerales bacterium]|nr:glycosyltransferase [Phycisphaerales bacterium]